MRLNAGTLVMDFPGSRTETSAVHKLVSIDIFLQQPEYSKILSLPLHYDTNMFFWIICESIFNMDGTRL
jgi:hypothetical protein